MLTQCNKTLEKVQAHPCCLVCTHSLCSQQLLAALPTYLWHHEPAMSSNFFLSPGLMEMLLPLSTTNSSILAHTQHHHTPWTTQKPCTIY
ncbi:hypothetical protein FKM82_022874 [Ascaphus truei]